MNDLVVSRRFCGPPNSGNGGYVCGKLAAGMPGPVAVTLRKPPPLERPLRVEGDATKRRAYDGDELVGEAHSAPLDFELRKPPPIGQLELASQRYEGLKQHAYPSCFVCGPQRREGDGLRIFAGSTEAGLVAAPWTPDASLAVDGVVDPAFLWAAMDCPGFWSIVDKPTVHMLLGRLTGELLRPLEVNTPCSVLGWELGREGRKFRVATALYTQEGELLGRAEAIWIALKAPLRTTHNLRSDWPPALDEEQFTPYVDRPACRIERIISLGHATAPGEWLVQDRTEFVLLHSGHAKLLIEGDAGPVDLYPGDIIEIPAGKRHRVEWTDPKEPSIWLAVHY